jgi:hypothetical protein
MNCATNMFTGWQSVGDKGVHILLVCMRCMYVEISLLWHSEQCIYLSLSICYGFGEVPCSSSFWRSPIVFKYHHWWRHVVKSPCTNKSVAGKSYTWNECVTRSDRFWLPCLREEHAVSQYEPNWRRQPLLDPTQQNKEENKRAFGSLRRDAVDVVLIASRRCWRRHSLYVRVLRGLT